MLYKIGDWINESSGQILDSIKSQYMNISTYRSLIGSSFVKLPAELKSPKKDLSTSKKTIKSLFSGVTLGILIQ